jgi:hypothetical protein
LQKLGEELLCAGRTGDFQAKRSKVGFHRELETQEAAALPSITDAILARDTRLIL